MGYFESRLFDKKGLLQYMLNNATYAIVSWNISSFFFLPGFWERKLLLSRSIEDFFIKGQKISNNQWIAVNNYNAKPRYYAPSWLDYIALSSHIADIKIIIIITFAYLVSRGKITRSRVTVARSTKGSINFVFSVIKHLNNYYHNFYQQNIFYINRN